MDRQNCPVCLWENIIGARIEATESKSYQKKNEQNRKSKEKKKKKKRTGGHSHVRIPCKNRSSQKKIVLEEQPLFMSRNSINVSWDVSTLPQSEIKEVFILKLYFPNQTFWAKYEFSSLYEPVLEDHAHTRVFFRSWEGHWKKKKSNIWLICSI